MATPAVHFSDRADSPSDTTNAAAAPYFKVDLLPDLPPRPGCIIKNGDHGDPSTITPYFFRAGLPEYAKWVPVAGMRYEKALTCVDVFIRSHIYQVMANRRVDWTYENCRKIGLILGVARAVMYAEYKISENRLITEETAKPLMGVTFPTAENAAFTYRCLAAEDPAQGTRGILTDSLALTAEELAVLPILVKCAHAVIPLQGYGLFNDRHHYLADKNSSSYKAFRYVEMQYWRKPEVKGFFEDSTVDVRDILWHKAGHPVSIAVKKYAATNEQTPVNLKAAGVVSAAMRLPVVESEIKAIRSYLQVTDIVKKEFEAKGGSLDNNILVEVNNALTKFPLIYLSDTTEIQPPAPMYLAQDVDTEGRRVTSRAEVVKYTKELIPRIQNSVAVCFGYYSAMVDGAITSGMKGQGSMDPLTGARSLQKLRSECPGSFHQGMEYYKDHNC